ncbi:prepro-gonadotropin-releasing hormone-like protein isoform X2 [Littorina saxatilis]|uniref:prepro-gonadotropin-releasing hormone-like protein isoform X2 n=1 Tax=Littorina saxatilis TaxID=31220 RepID=UPI0038B61830
MTMSRSSCTIAACLAALALLSQLCLVQGQNYHYSNGWHPGKRDGVKDALFRSSLNSEGNCRFRTYIYACINKLILDEIARIERNCLADDSLGSLKALLEPSAAPIGSKLEEDANKW